VERLVREARARGAFDDIGEEAWCSLGDRVTRESFVARLALPPGREAEAVSGDGLAYVGTGIGFVFGQRAPDELVALRDRCMALGGALVLERATIEQKRAVGVWRTPRQEGAGASSGTAAHVGGTSAARVAAELKRRFDPHDVLAPGRMPFSVTS
jgi:hypothetical protein